MISGGGYANAGKQSLALPVLSRKNFERRLQFVLQNFYVSSTRCHHEEVFMYVSARMMKKMPRVEGYHSSRGFDKKNRPSHRRSSAARKSSGKELNAAIARLAHDRDRIPSLERGEREESKIRFGPLRNPVWEREVIENSREREERFLKPNTWLYKHRSNP